MDVIERLGAAGIGFFVTGSEAMAVLGIAYRATNDIDLVLDLDPAAYERRLRPAFEPDYLVAPLLHVGRRWMGSAIRSRGEVYKADFVIREPDPWGTDALRRAIAVDDPGLGTVRVSTVEDLLLAKLEFADGDLDGLQGRDILRLLEAHGDRLDDAYLRRHAAGLGRARAPSLDEAIRRAGQLTCSSGELARTRELAESPRERARARAHQRWITQQRLWAAMDREGDLGARRPGAVHLRAPVARPPVPRSWSAMWRAVREQSAAGHPLHRPARATRRRRGGSLERLMRGARVRGDAAALRMRRVQCQPVAPSARASHRRWSAGSSLTHRRRPITARVTAVRCRGARIARARRSPLRAGSASLGRRGALDSGDRQTSRHCTSGADS